MLKATGISRTYTEQGIYVLYSNRKLSDIRYILNVIGFIEINALLVLYDFFLCIHKRQLCIESLFFFLAIYNKIKLDLPRIFYKKNRN